MALSLLVVTLIIKNVTNINDNKNINIRLINVTHFFSKKNRQKKEINKAIL